MKIFLCIFFIILGHNLFANEQKATDVAVSKVNIKDQKESFIKWGDLPIESFLSFTEWKVDSDQKDQEPGWERIVRERNHKEIAARIYQCVGVCRVDRGEGFFNGTNRTSVYEGDEVQTIGDSYAWIYFLDGTMVRMSPESSLTINEFNIGSKENFINARVNTGNILWMSREQSLFEEVDIRETDILFFPYAEYDSLPISDPLNESELDLFSYLEQSPFRLKHYQRLNEKIVKNNQYSKGKKTFAFIIMPNATLMGYSPTVEVVSLVGGVTYLKKRSLKTLNHKINEPEVEHQKLELQLRGYENTGMISVVEDQWIEVDEKGRSSNQINNKRWLDVGEFITKRIPSILHGREIFFERYSLPLFEEKIDPFQLAKVYGYRLWGELEVNEGDKKEVKKSDLTSRLQFLKEYFRRVETTNLVTNTKFIERISARGEKSTITTYGNHFFITALNRYIQFGESLQQIYNDKDTGEVLNSTKKQIWKKMHGIR